MPPEVPIVETEKFPEPGDFAEMPAPESALKPDAEMPEEADWASIVPEAFKPLPTDRLFTPVYLLSVAQTYSPLDGAVPCVHSLAQLHPI